MSSAGRSGNSDTEPTNIPGAQDLPADFTPDMLASESDPYKLDNTAPEDLVDVVEIVTMDEGDDETFDMGPTGFRWWYVPAIGMPAAIGAGAAIWYLTKGEEPYRNAWELVTRPVRTRSSRPNLAAAAKKTVRKAGATNDTLRDKVSDALGGLDAAELAERASDLWDDARDSMADLWDQITDRGTLNSARTNAGDARDAARRQFGKMVGNIAAAGTALAIQQKTNELAGAAREKARAARGTVRRVSSGGGTVTPSKAVTGMTLSKWLAQNRGKVQVNNLSGTAGNLKDLAKKQLVKQTTSAASKTAAKAAQVKTGRAVKKARKRVLSPIRRLRAFAFAALVTAMVIYVRSWYSRRGTTGGMDASDMRETASGRMEPDTWPRFDDLAPDAAAPTRMNAPTEPS